MKRSPKWNNPIPAALLRHAATLAKAPYYLEDLDKLAAELNVSSNKVEIMH